MLLIVLGSITGCVPQEPVEQLPAVIGGSHVTITAFLNTDTPCQQPTIDYLEQLEAEDPDRVQVEIVNISDPGPGRDRFEEAGLDSVAIMIDGQTTVSWEGEQDRRIISFMHPAGFAWTHEDLGQAVAAALRGELRPADPAEAHGVHLMDVSVRGQSIRISDGSRETGQLVINDEIALEISAASGESDPAQRVTEAAARLSEALATPFTPNQLRLKRVDRGIAVMAEEVQLLVATQEDAEAEGVEPETLADRWRLAIRDALIATALKRTDRPA